MNRSKKANEEIYWYNKYLLEIEQEKKAASDGNIAFFARKLKSAKKPFVDLTTLAAARNAGQLKCVSLLLRSLSSAHEAAAGSQAAHFASAKDSVLGRRIYRAHFRDECIRELFAARVVAAVHRGQNERILHVSMQQRSSKDSKSFRKNWLLANDA